jgi:hypothetical protein
MQAHPPVKKLFFLILGLWFSVNLLQAIFAEINADEAYYFLWGKYLDWGYFDHPPLAGVMTHISSLFFTGNLGARFMTVILQIATLGIIWQQLDNKNENRSVLSFFIIAASLVMFSAYGFITTPDAPLLFFTALFLFGYKKFLEKKDWLSVLMLALAMAGLIYSKYHGVLIIGFVMISNLRLLANGKFWLAGMLALVFCTPHFWWLYVNDFPSFKYQFAAFEFKFSHFLEYLPNQLAAFNPFILGAVIYIFFRYKPVNLFERAQYFIIGGFILFFWVMAYKGHVQAQWTVAASVPIIILLHNKMNSDPKLYWYSRKFIAPSLLLILFIRIILVTDLLPVSIGLSGKEPRYRAIEKIAKDKPVIFTRGYQQAALYSFFTGKPSTVISSLVIRRSQFDLWKFEEKWIDDSVYILLQANRSNIYDPAKEDITAFFANHLQTPNGLLIDFKINNTVFHGGDSIMISFTIENPGYAIYFKDPVYHLEILPVFRDKSGFVYRTGGTLRDEIIILKPKEKINNQIRFGVPDIPPGRYQLGLSCNSLIGPANNSNFIKVELVK